MQEIRVELVDNGYIQAFLIYYMVDNPEMDEHQIKSIRLYGFGGVLPFLLAAAGVHLSSGDAQAFFIKAFLVYGAVILSFVGAVHWGLIIKADNLDRVSMLLAIGVLPALLGWCALLCPPLITLLIFSLAFPSLFIYEQFAPVRSLLPDWYMKLRVQLTIIVTFLHFITLSGMV